MQFEYKVINGIACKKCSECTWQPLKHFHKHGFTKDGLVSKCKSCSVKQGRPEGYVTSKELKQKIGKKLKNRIFSKTHKENISESMKGKNNPRAIAVIINEIYYDTIINAARALTVSPLTVINRIKANKPGYKYATKHIIADANAYFREEQS